MKSKASFTHSGYYMLQFDKFLKVNFRNRMLVENAISPWGQSWERVFHKHLCIQFIALVPAIGGIEPLSLEWNARMLTTTLSIHSFKTRVDYNKLSYEIKGPISPTLHKPKLGWSILGIKAYLLLQTLLIIQFSACPSGISWRIIGI